MGLAQWQDYHLVKLPADHGMQVTSIVQDRDGYIYAAGTLGLLRFDGNKFHEFLHDPSDSTSVAPGAIRQMIRSRNGLLWMVTDEGKLCRFDPETRTFKTYSPELLEGAYINRLISLVEDDQGTIWIGAPHAQLLAFNAETEQFKKYICEELNPKNNPGRLTIRDLIQDPKNENLLWFIIQDSKTDVKITTSQQLANFNTKTREFKLIGESGYGLLFDNHNDIWGYAYVKNVTRYNIAKDTTSAYTIIPQIRDTAINWRLASLLYANDHFLVGTEQGVYTLYPNGAMQLWPDSEQFGLVQCLYKDKEGNIWLGGYSGLHVAIKSSIRYFPYSNFMEHINIWPAFIKFDDKANQFLLALNHHLEPDFDRSLFTVPTDNKISHRQFEFNDPIYNFSLDSEHRLWLYHRDQHFDIWTLDSTGINRHPIELDFKIPGNLKQFDLFNDSLLLATSSRMLVVINTKNYTHQVIHRDSFSLADGQGWTENYLRGHTKLNDSICLVYSRDLLRLNVITGTTSLIALPRTLKNGYEYIRAIVQDQNNKIWFGHSSRFFMATLFNDSLIIEKEFTINDGLRPMPIHKIHADQYNRIWVFGVGGLQAIDVNSFEVKYFGLNEGMPDIRISNEPLIELPDGSLAYSEVYHIVQFHPDSLWHSLNSSETRTIIEEVRIDGESIPFNNSKSSAINLTSTNQSIDISFQGIKYPSAKNLNYHYRILGLHDNWMSIGSNNFLTLPSLNSGNYEFQVSTNPMDSEPLVSVIRFRVPTPFHQSFVFYLLISGIILFGLYKFYNYRLRINQSKTRAEFMRQQEIMDLELKALRSQMNPHFMFNSLNSIKNYILNSDSKSAAKYLSNFSHLIRMILQYSREKNITLQEEIDMLSLYLKLEQLRFSEAFDHSISLSSDIEPGELFLPPMILQPFVENALWHGLATKKDERTLNIRFENKEDELHCSIEDNGIGREQSRLLAKNKSSKHKSLGMGITQDRIAILNKLEHSNIRLHIEDKKDSIGSPLGTTIHLFIPQHIYQD